MKNWKVIAEFTGIAAIVASLVFVGLQMRQTNENETFRETSVEDAEHLPGGAAPLPANEEDIRRQVMATETAFAKTMADRDLAAFAAFLAEDTLFYAGEEPLRGRQAVVDAWTPFYQGPDAPFSWQPERVELLDGNRLAYSSGPVHDAAGNLIGRFNSIWRYEGAGTWRIVFDKGSD